jgi:hypothetical protein
MSDASRSIADQGVLEAAIEVLLSLTEERRGDTFAAIRSRLIPALEEMRDRTPENAEAGQSTGLANMQNAARYLVTEVVPRPGAFATGTVVLRRIAISTHGAASRLAGGAVLRASSPRPGG